MMTNYELELTNPPKKRDRKRLAALDAARGLAVIGMFIQHFALNETNRFVSGNTMILFILCSGISYSMMAQRMEERGIGQAQFRTRILARSVFIDLAGYLLILLNGPFAVVLPTYAMLYLLAMGLVRQSAKKLALISGILFLVCPPLMLLGLSLFEGVDLLSDIAGGPLSALAWAPVFVTGMAVGRLQMRNNRMAFRFLAAGIALLVPFKLIAVYVLPRLSQAFAAFLLKFPVYSNPPADPYAVWPKNTQPVLWQMLFVDAPQGGSLFELAIGTGVSFLILGVLLLIEHKWPLLLKPLGAAGRVALTLYALQFILTWGLQIAGVDVTGLDLGGLLFGDLFVGLLVLVIGGLLARLQHGPLEAMIRRFESLFDRKEQGDEQG